MLYNKIDDTVGHVVLVGVGLVSKRKTLCSGDERTNEPFLGGVSYPCLSCNLPSGNDLTDANLDISPTVCGRPYGLNSAILAGTCHCKNARTYHDPKHTITQN